MLDEEDRLMQEAMDEEMALMRVRFPHVTQDTLQRLVLNEWYVGDDRTTLTCPEGHGEVRVWMYFDNSCNYWEITPEEDAVCHVCEKDMQVPA